MLSPGRPIFILFQWSSVVLLISFFSMSYCLFNCEEVTNAYAKKAMNIIKSFFRVFSFVFWSLDCQLMAAV